ncbi:uncharacterized protein FFB20_07172 [Fusarium fujikuroi]|uniref:RRM domain-containing protein n=2 Tax=Fusarium fujikuroi TaxID=5127 RepID=S0E5M6_GIBF5|nr:uncharacterized protein FFUJ_07941 [Fusarium fujikuroi IMI 58289]KLO87169.1 uncharacterized protein LW93_13028 [Fusarium fujikuroi]KLP06913.1 uncharacterized protein Y057_4468 [Fusarium fujikuroi]KLP17015.1 uncharacterized protein LW94_9103 [Fusarium fujikuroi]QGI65049.1 hypothetical protein CEK27_009020 [Fusarium fujikuroi]QGI82303.1 hypothetical protein CEK25_009032 [Fusarium fujikuroi]
MERQMWRLKGQGGPSWPVSPDMFESNDYLSVDLEHPRKAALVRVFVEDDLASTGTAFKFACVGFRDSAAAKNAYEYNGRMMQEGGDDIVASMTKR